MNASRRIAYVIDPRFSGGTSAAVAAELEVVARFGPVAVHAIESGMFHGRSVAPQLEATLSVLNIDLIWNAPVIAADLVILHNPSFLKFQDKLNTKIVCRELIVVTHENFLRPGGAEGFDIAACLSRIDCATLALGKYIAPISATNRTTVEGWRRTHRLPFGWQVLPETWFNICAFEMAAPPDHPQDRRGRHSRPGFEKFPAPAFLDLCFPPHAAANTILGADALIAEGVVRPHWTLLPFRGIEVTQYFAMIDIMVYFTAATWRESFGRVLAEALAAGKLALSDPDTAASFDGGVIGVRPDEVDAAIGAHLNDPARFARQVRKGQEAIARQSADAFADMFAGLADRLERRAAA